jgi:transposase
MEDSITLRFSEQRRMQVLMQLAGGVILSGQAAELLSLSERQVRRLAAALGSDGPVGLIHGNRGRRPSNAVSEATMARVIELATTTYRGFNQHHLTEMLAEYEGIALSRSSVRRILSAAGVPAVRRRRPPRHRSRRDRYPREGLLLQLDASRHDWLEERGPRLSLVGAIDDATGLVPWACFREQEDAHGYFLLMRQVVRRHGIPVAVYSDQHSIFRTTKTAMPIEDQLEGEECRPTQFGRLLNELGVTLILARSPQAKGRIERLWGTFQDRLTSELRLAGAATRADAEQVLARYLVRHNRRFTIPAADPAPAWLPWPPTLRADEVFCFKYRRVVAHDNTVRFGPHLIDIPANRQRNSYVRARVEVQHRFDGSLHVYSGGACIARCAPQAAVVDLRTRGNSRASDELPSVLPIRQPDLTAPTWKPPHPWRRWTGQNP